MTEATPRPVPVAEELREALALMAPPDAPQLSAGTIAESRAALWRMLPPVEEMLAGRAIEAREFSVPGPDGAPDIAVTVLKPRGHDTSRPAVPGLLNIHGGGMMVGNRLMDVPRLADLVDQLGVVAATVEYRLAPEHPHPAPVEDCHAALVWFARNAAEFGVDPTRIVVMGGSAGGGLAAGVALIARDRGSVKLAGQLLLCPMIDDRNVTVSSHQYLSATTWTRSTNELGWKCLLGDAAGTDAASPYAAPARAKDLSGLAEAYIETGSAEMFRDENVEYASRIWATGGSAELHIWSGGFHGFDLYAPGSALTRAALDARLTWLQRVLKL
jgi:acetyl esterase/lipase